MSSLFKKPLDDISIEDINQLIDEGYPEGTYVEYKQELPSKKHEGDPWIKGASQIGEYARNKLLAEVVAFANAQGGYLIIGIEESEEKPPKAIGIKPIPRCAELAEKLRLQARDCIEPMFPLINTKEVVVDENGAGLVVVYVPQSRIAPHRLKQTVQCYLRRNDRSEKMTMREIQDLTLQRSQFMVGLNEQFKEKHESFQKLLMGDVMSPIDWNGLRITLIPISSDVWLDHVYKNQRIRPVELAISANYGNSLVYLNSAYNFRTHKERPILRGTRHENYSERWKTILEIFCDGIVEFKFLTICQDESEVDDRIYPIWILSFAINAMLTANRFRQEAGIPDLDYGMEVEISRRGGQLKLGQLTGRKYFEIETNPLIFPRLNIGSSSEFSSIMKILFRDIWDSAGVESSSDFEIQLLKNLDGIQ